MNFGFSVGDREHHKVDNSIDQFSGSLKILVDGNPVVKDLRMLSVSLVKRYEFKKGSPTAPFGQTAKS